MFKEIKISDEIASEARIKAKATHRSIAGQIEYWVNIGRIAEDNPSLPFSVIYNILLGRKELKEELGTLYIFEEGD